jgi:hypothetical protein
MQRTLRQQRADGPAATHAPPTAAPPTSSPRFAVGWAALVYAAATLTLAWPALSGGFLVNPRSDQYIAGYAFREFAAQSLRAGEGFPQWSPYLFGGMPYIAGMHGDIFYPTFLLRMILPTDVAMTWCFLIHLFLAGLFTYVFLRAWGVGFYGSLIGGLAYMLSGPIAAYASPGHDGKLFVSTLLPLTLLLLLRFIRDGRRWALGALAITIGLAVLSPHPQLLQYLLLAGGAWALFLAFGAHDGASRLPRNVAFTRLGLALAAVVVGAVIGAVQYLPVFEYVEWSPRAGGKGWEHAVSYSMPIEELLNTIVPQFSGMFDMYWGRNGIHLHSEYPGVVVLILAGAGMFAAAVKRNFRWFWLGVFVISLLWALGGSTPFYRIVYAIVPGTKFFRAPSTMMFVTMFSLAVFAALGAERIIAAAASIPKRFYIGWGVALAVVALMIGGGLAITLADNIAGGMSAAGYPEGSVARVAENARENQPALLLGLLRSVLFAALALGAIWMSATRRWPARSAAWALALLVVVDLWSIERKYWIFSPPARELFASDPAIDAIRNAAEPGRVVTADFLGTANFRDPMFEGAAAMVHRVRSVQGYHGNELGRYQRILQAGSRVRADDGWRQDFWRHANVHWLYTTAPDSLMPELTRQLGYQGQFQKVVGPVANATGAEVYLYRVPGENPAAWVAAALVRGTDEQAMATVLDPRFDPARAAIVDTGVKVPVADVTTVPAATGVKARVTRYEPGEINVQLDQPAPSGGALVVSENYYPGWSATIAGQDANVVRANFNLIGVVLPAGAREVQLRFTDHAFERGKTITLVALALALAALAAGVLLDRRRVSPAV